jgi:hypothetical protein
MSGLKDKVAVLEQSDEDLRKKKYECNVNDLWDTIKRPNI